ncbi:MAG: extracellular solute-binding protein [Puniceicoccales bacterium]|jgi:ABC-type Fe3+ transport system substrate-binding protein|nr:extracellular solute-binding protein [Puniceicoccales bacterium]
MFETKKVVVIAIVALAVGVPFIFREKSSSIIPIGNAETLVIITPHNEALRREYSIGFKKWYKAMTGKDVNLDWRYQGGGRDAIRYIESMFANNFRLHWTEELHHEWNTTTAAAFAARSEKMLDVAVNAPEWAVTMKFFESNVGCGADILFGCGTPEHKSQAEKGNLVPCELLFECPDMFDDDTIPEFLSGNRLWDRKGRWFGASLSAFGIIYNREAIEEDGIGFFPKMWTDIGRPEFFGKLAIVDPTKSSSTQKSFGMLIQQQMQICYDELLEKRGVAVLPKKYEAKAISDGWMNGLRLIQKIVANGRYFTESTTRPVVDVSSGNCLAGIAVDFYGSAEAKHLEERSGSKRFKFAMPIGGGAPEADPIGIFRGAQNPELAKKFIEFVLSLEGQKLLDFNLHTPGGPEKTTMRRVPILKTVYEEQYKQYRCDPTVDPYAAASSFTSHDEWMGKVYGYIGVVIKLAFIEPSCELSDAMSAIIRASGEGRERDAAEAYGVLSDLSDMSYENLVSQIIPVLAGKDVLRNAVLQNEISEKYRLQYLKAKRIAEGDQRKK